VGGKEREEEGPDGTYNPLLRQAEKKKAERIGPYAAGAFNQKKERDQPMELYHGSRGKDRIMPKGKRKKTGNDRTEKTYS